MTAFNPQSWQLDCNCKTGVVTIDLLSRGQCSISELNNTESELRNPALALYMSGESVDICRFDCDGVHPISEVEAFLNLESFSRPGKWKLVAVKDET